MTALPVGDDTPPPAQILAIGKWRNNSQLVADAARLGYLPEPVLDLTYGEGKFWTIYMPESLTTNDLDLAKAAHMHHDATDMPLEDGSFATVVFDPPYKLAGTREDGGQSHVMTMDERYGTGGDYVPVASVRELLIAGTLEACRLSRSIVLVKCMDQVNSGRIHWQTDDATCAATDAGFRKLDAMMLCRVRAQDPKRPQRHARRNYSTLLIFKRK